MSQPVSQPLDLLDRIDALERALRTRPSATP